MKKNFIRAGIIAVLALITYHFLAFMIPFAKTAPFWISYGFSLVGFGVVAAALYIAFNKTPDAKSRFYGFPIARIGLIYGIVQLALGFICMITAAFLPWWIAVILQTIALCAGVAGLITADVVVEEIAVQDEKFKVHVSVMRSLQSKLNQLSSFCNDTEAQKAVSALADEIKYSDPVSNDSVAEVEYELSYVVNELQQAVADGDNASTVTLARKASSILSERNRLCKLSK